MLCRLLFKTRAEVFYQTYQIQHFSTGVRFLSYVAESTKHHEFVTSVPVPPVVTLGKKKTKIYWKEQS